MLHPLAPGQVTGIDHPFGGYSFAGLLPPSPVPLPSRMRLLGGAELVVPPPLGMPLDAPAVRERAAAELSALLGGAFATGVAPLLTLHDALISPETRARYEAPGLALAWDRPRHGFHWMAARLGEWRVQACGEAGDLHCVSFHRPAESPSWGPDGDPYTLLAEVAPALAARLADGPPGGHLRDVTAAFSPGLFAVALSAPELRVRTGVRQTVGTDGTTLGPARVLRIDAGPGCRDWPGP
ncbi:MULTISPECIES: hypothetical protein [unclassified Streptomyces]|uniref:hypothetical protein n=1 Tax=unclassified Streptomyces TaxID=2593676 RepID=UPI00166165F9|nr:MULTISPECIES: hypothetical protein [unclassified Streptomyces]MBD0707006.1 hypothetical protein [Streptomyces sp. CBMA291]MBD0712945.1 hypothetical protein [Streptomyces sp. CBMA370]